MRIVPILVLLILGMSFTLPVTYASASTPAVHLRITTYSNPGLTIRSSKVQTGGTLYIVVSLLNKAGKPVVWTSHVPLEITLATKGGELSATTVFITSGNSNTSASFGLILYIPPSTTGVQRIHASATINSAAQTTSKEILVVPPPAA